MQCQYDKVIANFTKAIRLAPGFAHAYEHRAAAWEAKGNQADAEAVRQEFEQLNMAA